MSVKLLCPPPPTPSLQDFFYFIAMCPFLSFLSYFLGHGKLYLFCQKSKSQASLLEFNHYVLAAIFYQHIPKEDYDSTSQRHLHTKSIKIEELKVLWNGKGLHNGIDRLINGDEEALHNHLSRSDDDSTYQACWWQVRLLMHYFVFVHGLVKIFLLHFQDNSATLEISSP